MYIEFVLYHCFYDMCNLTYFIFRYLCFYDMYICSSIQFVSTICTICSSIQFVITHAWGAVTCSWWAHLSSDTCALHLIQRGQRARACCRISRNVISTVALATCIRAQQSKQPKYARLGLAIAILCMSKN
jgi:hypothetical protein